MPVFPGCQASYIWGLAIRHPSFIWLESGQDSNLRNQLVFYKWFLV